MTSRDAIQGVERAWGSPAALGAVCACGARGEHHHCAGHPPQPKPKPESLGTHEELRRAVLDALVEHAPVPSTNQLLKLVPRRRAAVLAALHELADAGRVGRNGQGWEVRP